MKTLVILVLFCSSLCVSHALPLKKSCIQWNHFEWVEYKVENVHFDKAALLIPITLKGTATSNYLQLDLGINSSTLDETPFRKIQAEAGKPHSSAQIATIDCKIGGIELSQQPMVIQQDRETSRSTNAPQNIIGSLGIDFFTNRILVLDYPAQRFAILSSTAILPAVITQNVRYIRANQRNDKIFIPLSIDETEYPDDFIFNMGTSPLPLVTTKALWQKATGRTGNEPDNQVLTLENTKFIGAPIQKKTCIGILQITHSMAYFVPEQASLDFENCPFRIKGFIGNEPFYKDYTVIIDLPHKRFGILQTSTVN